MGGLPSPDTATAIDREQLAEDGHYLPMPVSGATQFAVVRAVNISDRLQLAELPARPAIDELQLDGPSFCP
ncbi:MAG: hypothetical protein ABI903_07750 [Actinomycetota bacterium]